MKSLPSTYIKDKIKKVHCRCIMITCKLSFRRIQKRVKTLDRVLTNITCEIYSLDRTKYYNKNRLIYLVNLRSRVLRVKQKLLVKCKKLEMKINKLMVEQKFFS